jgi:hypothetical protein
MIKYTSNEIHIAKALLRWLRILTFIRSLEHSSIEHGCLPEIAHFLLMVDLSMMIRLSMIAIVGDSICIHTVKIVLGISKLTGIINETVAEGIARTKKIK